MPNGHRHATDRYDGAALLECSENPDHLRVELTAANATYAPSELVNLDAFDVCPVCGADVVSLCYEEASEVLK